jgi:hypothetical protein
MGKTTLSVTLLALVAVSAPALAARSNDYDPPTITAVATGHGKLVVSVQAGPSGAPAGFTLWWMKRSDFLANDSQWPEPGDPRLHEAAFDGSPTLNVPAGSPGTFRLGPGQSIQVEIGDLFDETGVQTESADELDYGTDYVVCGYANCSKLVGQSAYTPDLKSCTTLPQNCTQTQGYWKNHPGAWPVASLRLGNVTYSQAQLLRIFGQPARGNGLVSLAHQLIAAKLNIAAGAEPEAASATIAAADAQIGDLVVPPIGAGYLAPASTSASTQTLDDYNNGIIGPGHCGATPVKSTTWGAVKSSYR